MLKIIIYSKQLPFPYVYVFYYCRAPFLCSTSSFQNNTFSTDDDWHSIIIPLLYVIVLLPKQIFFTIVNIQTRLVYPIDVDYMDCWHCSSLNILRHRVALPSYVFTIVRARARRFGPWYNQSFWHNTMVYVSYIAETEAVNANNICRKL